ncbi:MAG TPA: hypothetical protein VFH48_32870 [Chloroflexota bacterium]|nr:hypothetical protein [Chloroflexota bacterium]
MSERARSQIRRAARRLVLVVTFALVLALLGASAQPALAAAGDLDPSFDGDGKVTTSFGSSNTPMSSMAVGVKVQQSGRIVALGFAGTSESVKDFALAGYSPNGQLDPAFGTGGKVISPIGPGEDVANAMAIQADDKIVAVGVAYTSSGSDFAMARYLPNGSPDLTFSGDGKVITPVSSTVYDAARAVAVQQDGKIVAAGYVRIGNYEQFALVRYLTDGQLDPAFGNGGIVTTSFGAGAATAEGIAIQPNGRIVLVGRFKNDVALARYLDNGQLDPTFGTGGKAVTSMPAFTRAESIALQPDGMIVIGGVTSQNSKQHFLVMRYRGFGALDPAFGNGGIVTTKVVPGEYGAAVSAVTMHTKGTIVAAGRTCKGPYDCTVALTRYLPAGQLDPHFGTGGVVTTKFPAGYSNALAVAVGKADRIVVAGYARDANDDSDFALARFLAD